jgi:hypothetical protein
LSSIRLLIASIPMLALTGCLDPCDYYDKHEYDSPGGRVTASSYQYDCGATTPFLKRVSLRRKSSRFDPKKGLVFLPKVGQTLR